MEKMQEAQETDIKAALSEVAGKRKRVRPKKKVPLRVDAGHVAVDGDFNEELKVQNVPDGYVYHWLSQRDIGRLTGQDIVPVTWGNKWGCRPTLCGLGGERDKPITKNELSLFLEPVESRDARLSRDPARARHLKRMHAVRKAIKVSDEVVLGYGSEVGNLIGG